MWNSFGALRDRVRDNAKVVRENARAAAQVAQGVLIAAAAEDDEPALPANNSPDAHHLQEWDERDQKPANDRDGNNVFAAPPPDGIAPPPPPTSEAAFEPPPPPPDTAPPPPPPTDISAELPAAMPVRAPRTRTKRYVETGLTQPHVVAAVPPRPTMNIFRPPSPDVSHEHVTEDFLPEETPDPIPPVPQDQFAAEQKQDDLTEWGDSWGMPTEEQTADPENEFEGWGEQASEPEPNHQHPALHVEGNDTQLGFRELQDSNERAPESQMDAQGVGPAGEQQDHAHEWPGLGVESNTTDTVPKEAAEVSPAKADNAHTAQSVPNDWNSGVGDEWNAPAEENSHDNVNGGVLDANDGDDNVDGWCVPPRIEPDGSDDGWNVPAPVETVEDADGWGVPAQDTNPGDLSAWNIPTHGEAAAGTESFTTAEADQRTTEVENSENIVQSEAQISTSAHDETEQSGENNNVHDPEFPKEQPPFGPSPPPPVDRESHADGNRDENLPMPGEETIEPSLNGPLVTEEQSRGASRAKVVETAEDDGKANSQVWDDTREESHAMPNSGTIHGVGWVQSDIGESATVDAGVDWFSGQSVQPETSDPTQSEVSASDELFGSNTDSNLHREEQVSLPISESAQFHADEWNAVSQQTNKDSTISDRTIVGENPRSATSAFPTNDTKDESRLHAEHANSGAPQAVGASWANLPSCAPGSAEQNEESAANMIASTFGIPAPVRPLAQPLMHSDDALTPVVHAQDENVAIIVGLRAEVESLRMERDAAITSQVSSDQSIGNLERSMLDLRKDLARKSKNFEALQSERDGLLSQRDQLAQEKIEAEKERDAAVHQGGEGIREARGVIEAMRSTQGIVERREAVISEQIEALRSDLDRISEERNSFLEESNGLKNRLQEAESDARIREEELMQQIRFIENENEIAKLEREKAMTASKLHIQEHKDLLEVEQSTCFSLAARESRIRELEDAIEALHRERDEELVRIEAFSSQMEDMKERTKNVIQERNDLYDEKLDLERKVESLAASGEQTQRELMDTNREKSSILSERDEARQRYGALRDQLKDMTNQLESLSLERNELLQERTSLVTGSSTISEKEKTLAEESQRKTSQIALLQRKVTAAGAKIEKLTLQRAIFQRQRDEAGARLRAAGSEFATLHSKLQSATEGRDTLQKTVVFLRDEKDASLARIQELSEVAAQKLVVEENLAATSKQLESLQQDLASTREELSKVNESRFDLQQKCSNITTDMERTQAQLEIAARERDQLQSQLGTVKADKKLLQHTVKEHLNAIAEAETKQKSVEAELLTNREKAALDVGIAKAELAGEQKARMEHVAQLNEIQAIMKEETVSKRRMRETAISSLRSGRHELENGSVVPSIASFLPIIDAIIKSTDEKEDVSVLTRSTGEVFVKLCTEACKVANSLEILKVTAAEAVQKLEVAEGAKSEMTAREAELHQAQAMSEQKSKDIQALQEEKESLDARCEALQERLERSEANVLALHAETRGITKKMENEIEREAHASAEERAHLTGEIAQITSNLNSIWVMLQKALTNHQISIYRDDINDSDETSETNNVAMLTLRATASIVAELERNRTQSEDIAQRLATAEAEATRLVDRAEIAEQERDVYRGTNERLEKKSTLAFAEGEEKAKSELEQSIVHIEDELEDTKEQLKRVAEKAARSEKEAGELRALCSKLTAQFNGRTNELDEAEEKVVYLQDQVTNLDEDLEESHRRLKVLEEESTQARKSDVDRLSSELQEAIKQVESLENECARLREACDVAENSARESEFLAETHQKAEENLQIAIEQLEAAEDSAVEQRTIELQKRVEDAEERCANALEKEAKATMSQNKLTIRDEEIKELRGAIGRLADERVELKLELEKSLSRLNHPDAGGQLVDRRVVRQLLISYFRVGSIRRRDVLELMSRMLAFSDADNVAVGLKRRALMDRIGSLVQPPELDDATLPPLGTVSDKWIEFLMNETEEGDEQAKAW